MRHFKILGLCLVAVFALVAVAASSASAAEPEWGHCLAQKHGNYTEGNCATVATKHGVPDHKGHFEWLGGGGSSCYAMKHGNYTESACATVATKHGVPDHKGHYEKTGGGKFTGVGGAGVLKVFLYNCEVEPSENTGKRLPHEDCNADNGRHGNPQGFGFHGETFGEVECETEHASGEAVGTDEVTDVHVRFTGCVGLGYPANSKGLAAGEIEVNPLKGRLGYINKSKHEVGVVLEPATAGGLFVEFEMEEGELIQHVGEGNATEGAFYEEANGAPNGGDGIISPIEPVNQMTQKFTQNYRLETITPYLANSCNVSHTCPTGSETGLHVGESDYDYLNVPSHFENGPLEALEVWQGNPEEYYETGCCNQWSPGGEEITNVNTLAEGDGEIKA